MRCLAPGRAFCWRFWSAVAVWFFSAHGWLLYYGDAEAHLNIGAPHSGFANPGLRPVRHGLAAAAACADAAVRALSTRCGAAASPGSFLPPPALWREGCFCSPPCAASSDSIPRPRCRRGAVRAQSQHALPAIHPHGRGMFFGCLMALLYCTVRFRETQGWGAQCRRGRRAAALAPLTRYEGWFLIPFVAAYFLWAAHPPWFVPSGWAGARGALRCAALLGGGLAGSALLAGAQLVVDRRRARFLPRARTRPPPSKAASPIPGTAIGDAAFYYYRAAVRLSPGPACR